MMAREYLERTRDRIEGLCEALSADEANLRGEPGTWTINEVVEHLAITERRTLLGMLRTLKRLPASLEALADTGGKEETILGQVHLRSMKVLAPEPVRPVAGCGEWPGALEAFRESRSKTLKAEVEATEEFDRRVFPHPTLGNFTLRQWLLFTAAHSERHAQQIEEILGQAGRG